MWTKSVVPGLKLVVKVNLIVFFSSGSQMNSVVYKNEIKYFTFKKSVRLSRNKYFIDKRGEYLESITDY